MLAPARHGALLAPLALGVSLIGCTRGPIDGRLLFAEERPVVLVESKEVPLRQSLEVGNRFVSGWWPWQDGGELWMMPRAEAARLEVVDLGVGRRRLLIEGRSGEEATVEVSLNGRPSWRVDVAGPTVVELPAGLPIGRSIVEIRAVGERPPAIGRMALSPAADPGEAEWAEGRLTQSGNSIVEVVVPLRGEATLGGRLQFPGDSGGAPRLARLFWEDEAGVARLVGQWMDGPLGGFSKRIAARIEGRGFVRLSFVVTGRGDPVLWDRLALIDASPHEEPLVAPVADQPTELQPPRVVVVYVMDALRADFAGYAGGRQGATPTLDRLAAEGLAFLSHRSNAPNTLPSTKTLFTGHVWRRHGGGKLATDRETLAEVWRRAGYRTGLFTGNVHVTPAYAMDRGFDHVASEGPGSAHEVDHGRELNDNAARVHRALLEWLDSATASGQIFAYVHTVHPHNPYAPPAPWAQRFTAGIRSEIDGSTRTLLDVKHRRRDVEAADRERLTALYAANLAYNDALLEELLTELATRYRPGEVLLVVTSDHGEELFDHDGVLHGYTLYAEQLRIPLLFWWPGRVEAGGRVREMTDTVDLHRTLAALARGKAGSLFRVRDLETPADAGCSGSAPDASPPSLHFAAASSLKGGIFSAATDRWKLVLAPRTGDRWGMGEGRGRSRDPEYLFDLCSDPGETHNRAGDGDLEADWLRQRLLAWLAEPREAEVEEETLSPEDERSLRALGYLD
jgi:arylsulfatase A-like enzyme